MRLPLLLAIPLAACSAASATAASRDYPVRDFSAVELRGSPDVDIRVGGGFSVRAEGSAKFIERLEIRREGDALVIGTKPGWNFGWDSNARDRVIVTLPRLAAARLRGSGDIRIDQVTGPAFEGSVRGSGDLSIDTLRAERVAFAIEGSGDISARGQARSLDLSVTGSGDIRAGELSASGAQVSVRGSGNVTARVNGAAAVSLLGSGDVDLGSGARCTISKRGPGDVRCG